MVTWSCKHVIKISVRYHIRVIVTFSFALSKHDVPSSQDVPLLILLVGKSKHLQVNKEVALFSISEIQRICICIFKKQMFPFLPAWYGKREFSRTSLVRHSILFEKINATH